MDMEIDVLVVGAGPVGLFCALELHRHGLRCRIIDKKAALSDKSKALGIHVRTLEVFKDVELISPILKEGHTVIGALFKSYQKELMRPTLTNLPAEFSCIIDLPQDRTEAILDQALQSKQVHVEWNTELLAYEEVPNGIVASIRQADDSLAKIKANWIVACDGAHSTLRQLANIPFEGSDYKHRWWLADVHIHWQLPSDRMVFFVNQYGPMACFPMKNNRYRLVLTAPENIERDPEISDIEAAFRMRCAEEATISDPIWITKFYLHHRQITQYRKGRIFFAGDAAHIHSPMGGQGLNTGLQDIYNLIWKLALVEQGQSPNTLLDSYHQERYPVGKKVLQATDKMTKLVTIKNPILVWCRNWIASKIMSLPFLQRKIAIKLAELDINYPKREFIQAEGSIKGMKPGAFIPHIAFQNSNQARISLSQMTQGIAHHVLLFIPHAEALPMVNVFAESLLPYVKNTHTDTVKLVGHVILAKDVDASNLPKSLLTWQDSENFYKNSTPGLIVVRPDKYIGFVQSPFNTTTFKQYLSQIFM